jgi:hypothetical protein
VLGVPWSALECLGVAWECVGVGLPECPSLRRSAYWQGVRGSGRPSFLAEHKVVACLRWCHPTFGDCLRHSPSVVCRAQLDLLRLPLAEALSGCGEGIWMIEGGVRMPQGYQTSSEW